MVTVTLGTHDIVHLRVVFAIYKRWSLAPVPTVSFLLTQTKTVQASRIIPATVDLNGEFSQLHLGQYLSLLFADTELFDQEPRDHYTARSSASPIRE